MVAVVVVVAVAVGVAVVVRVVVAVAVVVVVAVAVGVVVVVGVGVGVAVWVAVGVAVGRRNMIDFTQPIETDETPPRPVRVLATDGPCAKFPVIAVVGNAFHREFSLDGRQDEAAHVIPLRLRNAPAKPVRHERWVCLYADGTMGVDRHTREECEGNARESYPLAEIRRIAWNSDGSPPESELLPEYMAMESDRDHWKGTVESLLAEIERQRVAHDDHLNRMMEQVNGANYYRKLSEEKVEALQAEVGSMKPVVDAAVAGVDSFNRRGLLRLIEAVRAYQNQPCPTCDGGMIYLKRTQCHDCNGTGKKVNTR